MDKPDDLIDLLEELRARNIHGHVLAPKDAKASVFIVPDEQDPIALDAEECKLVFASVRTVTKLFLALGSPDEASLLLTNLTLDGEVLTALEERFLSVDED